MQLFQPGSGLVHTATPLTLLQLPSFWVGSRNVQTRGCSTSSLRVGVSVQIYFCGEFSTGRAWNMKNKTEAHDCAWKGWGRNTELLQRHRCPPPNHSLLQMSLYSSSWHDVPSWKRGKSLWVLLCLLLVASTVHANPPIFSPNTEL